MIKVLIADDDCLKASRIENLLTIKFKKDIHIDKVDNIIEAKRSLLREKYDLLILDLNMPLNNEDECLENAGYDLYQEISTLTGYIIPSEIIFCTSHENLKEKYERQVRKGLFSIVKYNGSNEDWFTPIGQKASHINKVSMDANLLSGRYEYDMAIITAVEVELKSVMNIIDDGYKRIEVEGDSAVYYTGYISNSFKKLKVVFSKQTQMGMTASTALSMKLINNFKPKYLCMIGIAAGKKGKGNLGDIIAVTQSWDYSAGKIATNSNQNTEHIFLPSPNYLSVDIDIIEKLNQNFECELFSIKNKWNYTKINSDLKLLVGQLACGPAVIQDDQILKKYIDPHNRGFIGVDMESYGVVYAAKFSSNPRPKAFVLKSICDFADASKNDDFQSYAAYTSASFLKFFSLNELDFNF